VKLGVVGTQKRQFSVSTVVDQYFLDRALRLSFVGSARRFPDSFWPIGPNTPESSQEHYRRDELTADIAFLFCDRRGLCLGPAVRVEGYRIAEAEAGGLLASGQVVGGSGTSAWSTGLYFESDSRDSVYFPHGGGLIVGKANLGRSDSAGRGATLGRLEGDLRRFVQLHGEHVLALQGVVQLRFGDTPFELMPLLGGDALLRGSYQGRYRDQQLLALQAEYRFPVVWRLGGVLFGGCGEVAGDVKTLASSTLHAAGGGGVRVTLDREAHINLRVDIATNQRGAISGYLSIAEAF
jgi:outer membrane protein assembly factor BamA